MRLSSLQHRRSHRLRAATASVMLPATALAHPGHDHGHWTSAGVHGLLLIGVAAVCALVIWGLARWRRHQPQALEKRSRD